ncbi:MAG: hypothetical protein IJW54_05355 [Clostridia bacterium]|nr:hypothetical protein [Clostridia bacterium]
MEKRVFRAWEDTRVKIFLIVTIFLIPFLLVSNAMLFKSEYQYPAWKVIYGICSIFIYIVFLSYWACCLIYKVTLLPEGVLYKQNTLQIIPYSQISKIRFIYSKRDENGNFIKPTHIRDSNYLTPKAYTEFTLNDGKIYRIRIEGMTKKLTIKILEEIKARSIAYNDALKDFDPIKTVKKSKFTFKEPKESFIIPKNLH